jgi:hypothetical protein
MSDGEGVPAQIPHKFASHTKDLKLRGLGIKQTRKECPCDVLEGLMVVKSKDCIFETPLYALRSGTAEALGNRRGCESPPPHPEAND